MEEGEECSDDGDNANTEEEGEEQEEDEDSEGDISFNDDQMFQLDATLGAYFNSMKNGGNKKITEQERIGRVMRVLTCINVLIKKQSDSPSLLNLPATLLVVLLTARKREILTLVQKTSGLFESLVKCKSVPEARQADELELQLHRALYLASRHEDLQVRRTAIQGYIFLVRASLQNTECERVGKDSLSAAIGDYFDKKKSKLSLQIFQQLLTRVPRLSEIIFPIVLNKCNTARNSFIRGTGIAILEIAVKNASGGLAGILRGVSSDVVQLFLDVISNSVDKVKSSTNVIKAAQRLAQAMKGKGLGLAQIMSHAKAKEALQRLKDAAKNNPKETSLARLVELLETGSLGESNDEDNNNNNKRKKRASQISKQKKARK